mmetsp:Transcript_3887/g.5946  ORF Transcript_3887/g.5946 Transcript_3887/m.5946 type:complete len:232 (-) Transcript_3887:53-748(-)
MWSFILISSHGPTKEHLQIIQGMQDVLMLHLIGNYSPNLYTNTTVVFPCLWEGVTCNNDGLVETIEWKNFRTDTPVSAKFSLEGLLVQFLPSTLKSMTIHFQKWAHLVRDAFDTRCLPLRAIHVSFLACGLMGTLDLSQLPSSLVVLDLRQNRFEGTIELYHLPPSIQRIQLERNSFVRVVIDNDSLPKSLIEANFLAARKIEYYELRRRKVDDRIFVYRQRGEKAKRERI